MSAAVGQPTMTLRSRIRDVVARWMSAYDPEAEARKHDELRAEIAASTASRIRAVRAIHRAEAIRAAYTASAERLEH